MRYLLAPHLERPTRTIDRRDLERLLHESEQDDEHERPTVRVPVAPKRVEAQS